MFSACIDRLMPSEFRRHTWQNIAPESFDLSGRRLHLRVVTYNMLVQYHN